MIRYIPAVVWVALLGFVLVRHVKVYRLYDRQLKLVRQIEADGGVEDGSTLVAYNQRIRYVIRIALAVFGIGIGVAGTYGLYNTTFGTSLAFAIVVLTYFFASEVATGYLTIRDQRVIDYILQIDGTSTSKRSSNDA